MSALIVGITGQDGGDLAELLRAKGFEIHGINLRGYAVCDYLDYR